MNRPKADIGSIGDLLGSMVSDPEQPEGVGGHWRYAALGDGALESGVWEATVATWHEDDYPVDEVCVMLSGHLRLTETDDEAHDLREGDVFYLARGWAGTWEVVDDMRKFYVVLP